MPYACASLKEHNSQQDSVAYSQQICHVNSASQALAQSLVHGPINQPRILHPPDFHHYPTTPRHCLIWVDGPLIRLLALSSGLVPGFKALLNPFGEFR
jgi:hypothetical protein